MRGKEIGPKRVRGLQVGKFESWEASERQPHSFCPVEASGTQKACITRRKDGPPRSVLTDRGSATCGFDTMAHYRDASGRFSVQRSSPLDPSGALPHAYSLCFP